MIKVVWTLSLQISDYTVLTPLLVMMWADEMPSWWDEERQMARHCDAVFGYFWPSDGTSEGGTSVSRPQLSVGNWNHGKWNSG